jgi:putative ABC transport system permease protein
MQFIGIVWRNLMRRKTRTVLTIAGLSIAVAAVVALVGVSDGFSTQFQKLYDRRHIDIVVQRAGGSTELNNALPVSLGAQIGKVPHVTEVIDGLMDTWSFPEHDMPVVIVNGWPADSPLFKDQHLLEGRPLTSADHGKVWVGKKLAANLHLKIGDQIAHNEEKLEDWLHHSDQRPERRAQPRRATFRRAAKHRGARRRDRGPAVEEVH